MFKGGLDKEDNLRYNNNLRNVLILSTIKV